MALVSVFRKSLFLLSLLFMVSCNNEQLGYENNVRVTELEPNLLSKNKWAIVELLCNRASYYLYTYPPFEYYFEFLDNGNLMVSTPCNRFTFNYTIRQNKLSCNLIEDDTNDCYFTYIIRNTCKELNEFEVRGDSLLLKTNYESGHMILVKV